MKRLNECGCNSEMDHSNTQNYMFFQNLKTIHHAVGKLLKMDPAQLDELLSNGHAWAVDHITTSADDIEEVYHFIEDSGVYTDADTNQYDTDDAYNSQQPHFVPVTFNNHDEMKNFIREIIRKVGNHYELKSHTNKTLGKGTKEEMEKRERQVNYFKHLHK